jgi:hypothetical protein
MAVEVTVHTPGQPSVVLQGVAKNASLEGARVQLPEAVPEGSLVSVRVQGGVSQLGSVRWSLPGESGFLHGVRFQSPMDPTGSHARPLRRLRLRQVVRRALIVLLGSALMAAGAYGLDRFIESLRRYEPKYYEPKDIERQLHDLRRLSEQERPAPQRDQ